MNKKILDFLILAIIVIVFLWFLQKNKNEHLDAADKDNLTSKKITATDSLNGQYVNADLTINAGVDVNAGKNVNAKGTITGKNINATGATHFTGFGTDSWFPFEDGKNYIRGPLQIDGPTNFSNNASINGALTVDGTITANKIISKDGSSSTALSNEAIQSIASVYNKDNLTATNINATGTTRFTGYGTDTWFPYSNGQNYIRGTTNIDGAALHNGPVYHTNLARFTGKGTDTWFPADDGRNYIRGPLNIDGPTNFTSSVNFSNGFKTPIDLNLTRAGQISLWQAAENQGKTSMCPNGYYVAGFTQDAALPQYAFYPECRKLPGA